MKKLILLLFTILSFTSFSQQSGNDWNTDMNKAIQISQQTGKPLMLFFTGSDWCGWCKRLVKEVYKTPEFNKWAKKNVVLVEIDFPRRTKLSEELTKQNRELQQMFGVRGYPTIWFISPKKGSDGKVNLNVIDQGEGFGENDTAKIFKRFYSNRPGKFGEHSGLGLNIVKNLVELHNGHISASNNKNKGAKIEIIFPKA